MLGNFGGVQMIDYNSLTLKQAEKFYTGEARTESGQMPVNNKLEIDNPIRKKVNEKFETLVTVGPSDYHHGYGVWNIEPRVHNESGKEVCIYSKYQIKDRVYHLGMIDFETQSVDVALGLMSDLTSPTRAHWLLYKSGRSFHGYIKFGLSEQNGWAKFMGRLLIANEKDKQKVVDDRWVGWCLLKGWAALRITKNDPHYLQVPELVAESNY
jgi:hypothetical protein